MNIIYALAIAGITLIALGVIACRTSKKKDLRWNNGVCRYQFDGTQTPERRKK